MGAAEEGCRALEVDYELLPAVFDPEQAMQPGAPLLHNKGGEANGNIFVDIHGEMGNVEAGFKAADVVHEGTYSTSRVQHAHLETHGCLSWSGDDGRLHVRTSTQTPFITKKKLCYLFGLFPRSVHVFTERVGGGFGGKQEMITEDLCLLATLKTGRPVKWEFTREEQFIAATTRHPMTIQIKLGAKQDGTLTAMQIRIVSNTGAYGGHGGERSRPPSGSPITIYRCANKKGDGYAVYTNMIPGGGFRGYGASQPTFAIESAMDDLAQQLGIGSFEIRRKNMIRPGDWMPSIWPEPGHRVRQLRAGPVPRSRGAGAGQRPGAAKPAGDDWLEGSGHGAGHAGLRATHRTSLGCGNGAPGRWRPITWPSVRPSSATDR